MAIEADIIKAAISNLPLASARSGHWARRVLKALVPVVMQASLTKEEGRYPQFSIAVIRSEDAFVWESVLFKEPVECTPQSIAKIAALSKAGTTHLVATEVDKKLMIIGIGQPPQEVRSRIPPSIASAIAKFEIYSFVIATILGPHSVLIEGFGTELAFLFDGKLRSSAEMPESHQLRFIAETSGSGSLPVPRWVNDSMEPAALRATISMDLLEKLARGAWFSARGGIFAFSRRGRHLTGWGISSCRWISLPVPLLQASFDYWASLLTFVPDRKSPVAYIKTREKESQADAAVSHAVRMSQLDGAVLINEDFEVVAFGAKLRSVKPKGVIVRHGKSGIRFDLQTKGTRHLSAYSWVAAKGDRMAMVVSQDREIRIFDHSPDGEVVYWDLRPPLFT